MAKRKTKKKKTTSTTRRRTTKAKPKISTPRSTKTSEEDENFAAIYVIIALAFVSLVVYVTQIQPEHANDHLIDASFARPLASQGNFSCSTTERGGSAALAQMAEKRLTRSCDLSKPFSIASSRFQEFKTPKLWVCCWKK